MFAVTASSNDLCKREYSKGCCCKGSLTFLPLLWAAWTMGSLAISYAVAISLGHIHGFLPFISQISMMNPEYIFSVFACSITSILGSAIMYIEYCYIDIYYSDISGKWNKILLCCGLLSYLGFLVAAYVSVLVAINVHLAGAIGGFGLNCLYNFCHSIVCLRSSVWQDNKQMVIIRLCFSVSSLAFILMLGGTHIVCMFSISCTQANINLPLAVLEWLTLFGMCGYILTFTKDFQRLRLTHVRSISKEWTSMLWSLKNSMKGLKCNNYMRSRPFPMEKLGQGTNTNYLED
ncbi:DNA damage-regulated autophagy modulator protein 1 [Xenopus laevis]|uniref:DNA damage-regulated autophagy modulator protein 1 n=1 Tax=Xenopus laevis TaxID=8355 RepID=A0A8J0TAI0_XENLA|nr:DNA damage-regulated autophagy modulator protein 1 [Xenopus laevis]